MFCDQTILKLRAGDGGNGCVAFRREKFVAKGGPNGGDGGKGGNILFKVNHALNTLTHLDTYKQFFAEKGEHGKGQNKHGADAEDLVLEVPLGTIVRKLTRDEEGKIIHKEDIADLSQKEKTVLVVKGGRGGYGNAHFVSSVRQAPKFAELGEEGEEIEVGLELKLVADIGIIGIPSAGKSTLISVISNAKPKIAEYHFTTLVPHLGVVKISDKATYVVADIPGLIEGAHSGKGLGVKFLKHIQRCRFLVHLIDPLQANLRSTTSDEEDPAIDNFHLINQELKNFSEDLGNRHQFIVINKSDVTDEETLERLHKKFAEICTKSDQLTLYPHAISAATTQGINELKNFLHQQLQQGEHTEDVFFSDDEEGIEEVENTPEKSEHKIYKPHLDNPKYFAVEKNEDGSFSVSGQRITQIVNMTNFENREAVMRVHDVLTRMGINRELKKQGAKDGDTVFIGKHELEYQRDV